MVKILDWSDINCAAVAHVGKPAVYIANHLSFDTTSEDEILQFVVKSIKEIYGDGTIEFFDIIAAVLHSGLIFFDTEEEQHRFYQIFEQPLTDSSAIYACTYDAYGNCMTENT